MGRDISIDNGILNFDTVKGDFKIRESINQETEHILRSNKGVWRQNPLVGVGLFNYLNGSSTNDQIKKVVKIGLEFDDLIVENIIFEDDEIEVLTVRNEN